MKYFQLVEFGCWFSSSCSYFSCSFFSFKLLLLAPLVLLPHLQGRTFQRVQVGILDSNLFLLCRGEVILDVEGLPNLLGSLALDHVGNSFAGQIQQTLDVQVIGSQDELKESSLIYLRKESSLGDL